MGRPVCYRRIASSSIDITGLGLASVRHPHERVCVFVAKVLCTRRVARRLGVKSACGRYLAMWHSASGRIEKHTVLRLGGLLFRAWGRRISKGGLTAMTQSWWRRG